jgi:hypothetical protein
MTISLDSYLNAPGSFHIYVSERYNKMISIGGYTDDVKVPAGAVLKRYISWSADQHVWTPWELISNSLQIAKHDVFYFKIMFKLLQNDNFEFISLNSFSIDIVYGEELATDYVFEQNSFSEIADSISARERDVNMWLNEIRGIPVQYYRTLPEKDSKDVILNEYSIRGVVECKTIGVIAENIPDSLPQYTMLGIDVEKFEIEIDYSYFQKVFGKCTKPRIEDRVYIPMSNILYRVSSVHIANGIKERTLYWVLSLRLHDELESMLDSAGNRELEEMSVTHDDIFSEEILQEYVNAKNEMQTGHNTSTSDKIRTGIAAGVTITEDNVTSNSHIVSRRYYDVNSTDKYTVAYKNIPVIKEAFAISLLFNFTSDCTLLLDEKNIIFVSAGRLKINTSQVPVDLIPGKWYGVVINVYDKNSEVSIWEMKTSYRDKNDTSFNMVTTRFVNDRPVFKGLGMGAGIYKMTNVRIWKVPVPTEYQNLVITSPKVDKPANTYFIDNCEPKLSTYSYGIDITK